MEQEKSTIPFRAEMEAALGATVVTFDDRGVERPGGACNCCGGGPTPQPDWRGDPWYIYRAGICDSDGVFYAMLCEGCLEELRAENAKRPLTERDENARLITDLMGDDLDGAQGFMDDLLG